MLQASSVPRWMRGKVMKRAVLALAVLVLGGAAPPAASQELTKCHAGQQVIDKEGWSGVIVADDRKLCQVKIRKWSDL